jgi:hypothetical protein
MSILERLNEEGLNRRGFLNCMRWAGDGTIVDRHSRSASFPRARPESA